MLTLQVIMTLVIEAFLINNKKKKKIKIHTSAIADESGDMNQNVAE
jgi:hypothetical protein